MKNKISYKSLEQSCTNDYIRAMKWLFLVAVGCLLSFANVFTGRSKLYSYAAAIPFLALSYGLECTNPGQKYACFAIAALCPLFYLLCAGFCLRRLRWLIAGTVFFLLDTVCYALVFWSPTSIPDLAIGIILRVIFLYYMFRGIVAMLRLVRARLNGEHKTSVEDDRFARDSRPLRIAELEESFRTLLEDRQLGHTISYRKSRSLYQLVIDGYIYDEIKTLSSNAHTLTAVLDGHTIMVGYDGDDRSFLSIDGETIKRKFRIL